MLQIFNRFFSFLFFFSLPLFLIGIEENSCDEVSLSRLKIKQREHTGVGFDQGYSSLSYFLAPSSGSFCIPFFDARLHVFNSGYLASNLGFGTRFALPNDVAIFGVNTYYDFRNYKSFSSHQASGGLEILSKWVDFRINGYYPFSGKTKEGTAKFASFQGNNLYMRQHLYYAFPYADTELGFTLPNPLKKINLYIAFGGYYLFKQSTTNQSIGNICGGKIRLTATPKDYISFGVEYTKDALFGSRVNGYLSLQVPLGKRKARTSEKKTSLYTKGECNSYLSSMKRKLQDPIHNEIIPFYSTNFKYPLFDELLYAGRIASPYKFIFVSNVQLASNGVGSGSGTFENPYTTLALAQNNSGPNDIIYVFYGKGTSAGYNEGFIFKPGQKLTSSGVTLTVSNVKIPPYTPGKFPFITNEKNPNNPTILASNAGNLLLNGFNLTSTQSPAISLNSTGGLIQNNNISASTHGIDIISLSENNPLLISSNKITGIQAITLNSYKGSVNVKNNTLLPLYSATNDSAGIYATSLDSLRLTATNNTITYNNSSALGYGVYFSAESSSLATSTLTLTKNTISTSGSNDGISIYNSNNSIIHGTINDNAVLPLSAEGPNKGILISSGSGEPLCINVINNDNVLGYSFLNTGSATFQLPSVNSAITGVLEQNGNTAAGNYTTAGKISYVPTGSPCPPFEAVFVDNSSTQSITNGSFLYPWKTLTDAQNNSSPGNLIYVFTGDGTTRGYNEGITLKENQTIAGSSVSFAYKGSTIQGSFGSSLPQIVNSGSAAIITAPTSTRIIGLSLTGSSSNNGIQYITSSATNKIASIEQSIIAISGSNTSAIVVNSNDTNLTLSILDNRISSAHGYGIFSSLGSNNNIMIDGNDLASLINYNAAISSSFSGGDNSIGITNNNIYSSTSSILINNSSGVLTEIIENNVIQNLQDVAIGTTLSGSKTLLSLNNNTIRSNAFAFEQIFVNSFTGSISKNNCIGSIAMQTTTGCITNFSGNSASSFIFSAANIANSGYYFQQSQTFVNQNNTGPISFVAQPGYTITEHWSSSCP